MFDSVEGPFYNVRVDQFAWREFVEGGPVGGFDDEHVASFWLCCFGGEGVDAVYVAGVEDGVGGCLDEELGRAEHVTGVERSDL